VVMGAERERIVEAVNKHVRSEEILPGIFSDVWAAERMVETLCKEGQMV